MQRDFERAVILWNARKRQWRMGLVAALTSTVLVLLACWGAGLLDQWRTWFPRSQQVSPIAQSAPVAPPSLSTPETHGVRTADDGAVGKFRLIATQPGRNAREGIAQIATDSADPLTYIAGALLANGASLVEIHADHVVLKRDNLTTELFVDGVARNVRAAKTAPVHEELLRVTKPIVQPAAETGPETYDNLLRSAPRFVDNRISGFNIYAGTDAAALSRLNLQSGDVLLEIDSRVLTSIEQLHSSLKSISAGASLTATVLRGAEAVIVNMDGTMLKAQAMPALADVPR